MLSQTLTTFPDLVELTENLVADEDKHSAAQGVEENVISLRVFDVLLQREHHEVDHGHLVQQERYELLPHDLVLVSVPEDVEQAAHKASLKECLVLFSGLVNDRDEVQEAFVVSD